MQRDKMFDRLQTFARQSIRAIQRGDWFPILLPHYQLHSDGLSALGGPAKPMPAEVLAALKLCDGTRTLAQVAKQAGTTRRRLLESRAEQLLILWPQSLPPAPSTDEKPAQIILSPHLDDAALSLGGLMIERPQIFAGPVLVVDVFSRVSWWRFDLGPGQLPLIQATRDAEESLVLRLARCAARRWGHGEAPLRDYKLSEIFTADIRAGDEALRQTIRQQIAALAGEFPEAVFFVPLGVGNHVDHRLLRDAAIDVLQPREPAGRAVRFYEDLPYAAKTPGVHDFSKAISGMQLRAGPGVPLKKIGLKQELLRTYWSQLKEPQIAAVGEYARRASGRAAERLWEVAQ